MPSLKSGNNKKKIRNESKRADGESSYFRIPWRSKIASSLLSSNKQYGGTTCISSSIELIRIPSAACGQDINCTGSVEVVLLPVLLRITHWTKSRLPVLPPGLFPPWANSIWISYVWWGKHLNPEWKTSGFKNVRIHVDGALVSRIGTGKKCPGNEVVSRFPCWTRKLADDVGGNRKLRDKMICCMATICS